MYESLILTVLFFSLNLFIGVVGFYELHYRKRIEQNKTKLEKYVKTELDKLIKTIKIPMSVQESDNFSDRLDYLNTIVQRPDNFLRWRSWMILPILLELLFSALTFIYNTSNVIEAFSLFAAIIGC